MIISRRCLLKHLSFSTPSLFLAPWPVWAGHGESLRFGIIADVHKDIMHDADDRLKAFVDHMKTEEVDFIIQLGDFCIPKSDNKGFLDIWNSFPGPRYHVLGNHDTDGGFKREQTVAWWGMSNRFYSFDRGGIHFVVLDGNDRPLDHAGGYPRFIADDQLDWLRQDLSATSLPIMLFVHQSLERASKGGVQNGEAVRALLEEANKRAGMRQVVACFSGHHHRDYVRSINDILYPQINSASYYWVGPDFQEIRYSDEIDAAYPMIKNTVPYKDPLFAIVTIDAANGFLQIEGRRSAFVGPAPWELGDDKAYWEAESLTAGIADWKRPL